MERRPGDSIYALIGRAVVRFVLYRFRPQIRAAAAVAVIGVAIGAWLALTHDDHDEG